MTPRDNSTDITFSAEGAEGRCFLLVLLLFVCVVGNGSIGVLFYRFKNLRTIPNFLIGNLALVDLLNTVLNVPLTSAATSLGGQPITGRYSSLVASTSRLMFVNLNLLSMLLMTIDRFLAIQQGMKYMIWKSMTKALIAVGTVWLICCTMSLTYFISLWHVDLGDVVFGHYRLVYLEKQGKYYTMIVFPLILLAIALFALLTCRSVAKQRTKINIQVFKESAQSAHSIAARRRVEVQAAKTVGLIVVAYVVCFLLAIVYSPTAKTFNNPETLQWFGFFANYFMFISSACNPIIYVIRTKRFRLAMRGFWREPCGTSDLRQPPASLAPVMKAKKPGRQNADQCQNTSGKDAAVFFHTRNRATAPENDAQKYRLEWGEAATAIALEEDVEGGRSVARYAWMVSTTVSSSQIVDEDHVQNSPDTTPQRMDSGN